ncbi:MAG: hypothetical protein ABI534_06735 [Chloroflexota bacterium]
MKRTSRPRPTTKAVTSRRAALSVAILAATVLVVGHDLTFLAANGFDGLGVALARSGHGAYWPFTWLVAVAGLATLAAIAALRAARLLRAVRAGGAPAPLPGLRAYGSDVLRLWPRLALLALLVFVAQEAAEHYLMHGGHVLGVGDFVSGAYAAALPAFAGVALLVAGLAALFRRTIDALEEAIRSARVTVRRPATRIFAPSPRFVWLRSSLAMPDIGRAPPPPLAMC